MAFWGGEGLVESGVIANLSHPGGNVTGVSMLAEELEPKRLEYLIQALPKARIIGVLDPSHGDSYGDLRAVADRSGVQLRLVTVGQGSDAYVRAFDALKEARVEGLVVPSSPRLFQDSRQIIDLAAARRIPAIYEWPDMADFGGLMAYGPTFAELERAGRLVRAPDSQGCQSGGPCHRTAEQIRTRHQSQDGQGARHDDAAGAPATSGQNDPVTSRRTTVAQRLQAC